MNKALKILGVLIAIIAISLMVFYYYLNRTIIVAPGETREGNISLKEGSLVLEVGSVLTGNVEISEGNIELKEGAKIEGNITMDQGEIWLADKTVVEGTIQLKQGRLSTGEGSHLEKGATLDQGAITIGSDSTVHGNLETTGKIRIEENALIAGNVSGELEIHSTAQIQGEKPAVYLTYNWPEVLQYFDILPEDHKNALGLIILTKEKNGLVRDENIVEPSQYLEGVYDYTQGELVDVSAQNSELKEKVFKQAQEFFKALPERRMAYFDVGATTEDFALDPHFADIYLPSSGSETLILHEMGHVLDFKYDYSDFHQPKFPWTPEDAVSNYGATHPGEDFAEAYRLYALDQEGFFKLIKDNPERKKKYDFLKQFVFN